MTSRTNSSLSTFESGKSFLPGSDTRATFLLCLLSPFFRGLRDEFEDPEPFVSPLEKPLVVELAPFVWPLLLNEFELCMGVEGPASEFEGTAREVEDEDA